MDKNASMANMQVFFVVFLHISLLKLYNIFGTMLIDKLVIGKFIILASLKLQCNKP